MRLLLVEDDEDFGQSLVRALREQGYQVDWQKSGDVGLYQATEWDYDLLILDRMLPGLDGIRFLEKFRRNHTIPVLMLTALNTLEDRTEGLDQGADDYLGKPFDLPELFARIRALIRRAYGFSGQSLRCGELRLDPQSQQVFIGEHEVRLSPAEFRTVELLLLRKGRPVQRQTLEDRLLELSPDAQSNALEVHIHRIRQKLGKDFIQTRRGVGYLIEDPTGGKP